MNFISHPRIIQIRIEKMRYQAAMVRGCLGCNTLVILPTGLVKTIVVLRMEAGFLGRRKILMLVLTEPLVDQRSRFLSEMLSGTTRLPCAS